MDKDGQFVLYTNNLLLVDVMILLVDVINYWLIKQYCRSMLESKFNATIH